LQKFLVEEVTLLPLLLLLAVEVLAAGSTSIHIDT
jgi:hypothetical protein